MMKNNNEENFEVEDSEQKLYNGAYAMLIIGVIFCSAVSIMVTLLTIYGEGSPYISSNKGHFKKYTSVVMSQTYMIAIIIISIIGFILSFSGVIIIRTLRT